MYYDGIHNYESAKEFVKEFGWDDFLEALNENYPGRKLFSVSTAWYNNMDYLCKAKGANGDVLIGWEEWNSD